MMAHLIASHREYWVASFMSYCLKDLFFLFFGLTLVLGLFLAPRDCCCKGHRNEKTEGVGRTGDRRE